MFNGIIGYLNTLDTLMPKYTTDEIVKQFETTHGETYNYSLVNYTHSQTKVKIICKKHGVFEQLVGMHRKGQGCAECMYDGKRSNASDVITKFKEVHAERYDYSFVDYKNADSKVTIKCAEHGDFKQTPYHHASGNGCPKCIGRHKSQEDIIKSFAKAHGSRYNYSKVKFTKVNDKVEIICLEHGSFYQSATNHASGKGCIKCAGTNQHNTSEVIAKFIAVHGEKYDYKLVDYKTSHEKVKIVCSEHGVFEQTSGSHLSGNGCHKCASSYQPSTIEVVEQFKGIHSDKYDYSKVNYKGAFVDVEIICKTHGSFMQVAKTHKRGSGCPDCAVTIDHTKSSYLESCNSTGGNTYLYLIRCKGDDEQFYKVGIAKKGASIRFNSRRKLPYEFKIIKQVYGSASLIWDLEKSIHSMMSGIKYKPKLNFHGKTECFSSAPSDILKLLENFNESEQLMFLV